MLRNTAFLQYILTLLLMVGCATDAGDVPVLGVTSQGSGGGVGSSTFVIEFENDSVLHIDAGQTAEIPVLIKRSGNQDLGAEVFVTVTPIDGAVPGIDFTVPPSEIDFRPPLFSGRSAMISIPTSNTISVVRSLEVTLNLDDPGISGDPVLGSQSKRVVQINPVGGPSPPTVSFSQTDSSVGESDTTRMIEVRLNKQVPSGTLRVNLGLEANSGRTCGASENQQCANSVAGSYQDFTFTPSTLSFSGTTVSQHVTVTVMEDSRIEEDEVVSLNLTSVSNGNLGSITSHHLTIVNDDGSGTVDNGEGAPGGSLVIAECTSGNLEPFLPSTFLNVSGGSGDYEWSLEDCDGNTIARSYGARMDVDTRTANNARGQYTKPADADCSAGPGDTVTETVTVYDVNDTSNFGTCEITSTIPTPRGGRPGGPILPPVRSH